MMYLCVIHKYLRSWLVERPVLAAPVLTVYGRSRPEADVDELFENAGNIAKGHSPVAELCQIALRP